MTNDTFIKFDGIDGESADTVHRGAVQVLSWSWGLTATTASGGGGGSAGKATPQELRVVHRYDKASPLLAKTAASGTHLKTAVLTARKAGGAQQEFFKVTMKDVVITSVSDSDDGTGTTEQLAMTYGEIDFSYQPQDSAGNLGPEVKFDWNVKTGKIT